VPFFPRTLIDLVSLKKKQSTFDFKLENFVRRIVEQIKLKELQFLISKLQTDEILASRPKKSNKIKKFPCEKFCNVFSVKSFQLQEIFFVN